MGGSVNIRQLRYFHLVACTGNFSAAARLEDVSVQAVSKSIIELEDELGAPLFERGGKKAFLTSLGEALIGPTREAIASFDAVERAAESFGKEGEKRSDLRLALVSPPFVKHTLICGLMSQLLSRMLGIRTTLELSLGANALADLKAGNIDAFLTIGTFDDPRCVSRPIGTVSAGAFIGRRHPLRPKKLLSLADLGPYPVLYNREIDDFNETVLMSCRAHGLASRMVEATTEEDVASLLEHDGYVLGVYLKALDIKPFANMYQIDPADMPPVPICLLTLKERQDDVVDRLNNFVCNEFSLMKRVFSA